MHGIVYDKSTTKGKLNMSVSEARKNANSRYDAKTYKQVAIRFRIDDDKEILEDMELAKANGYSLREWVNEMFYKAKK